MLAVLSVNTVDSRWVRDELDAATVRRIEEDCRLIPVLVGDFPIPPSIRHLFQIRVQRHEVERATDEVLRAIFNRSAAPPLGEPPAYTTQQLPDMPAADGVVLRLISEATLREPYEYIDLEELAAVATKEGLSEATLTESLEVLQDQGYIEAPRAMAVRFNGMMAALATSEGLLRYGEWAIPHFDEVVRAVGVELQEGSTDSGIAASVGQPIRLIEAILDRFEAARLVSLSKVAGGPGHVYVNRVCPQLRRALQ